MNFIFFKMLTEWSIEINSRYFWITTHYWGQIPIIKLLNEITYLLNKGFTSFEKNKNFTILINVDDAKNEYLERKPFENIENFGKIKDELYHFARKNYKIKMKSNYFLNFNVVIDVIFNEIYLNEIYFDENLKFLDVSITLSDENYNKFNFEKFEARINDITFAFTKDGDAFARDFISKYKGYFKLHKDKFYNLPNELFYYSGSMIENDDNLNYVWRKNLFILTCRILFENHFQNDLLANPMAMMKIAKHLNKK